MLGGRTIGARRAGAAIALAGALVVAAGALVVSVGAQDSRRFASSSTTVASIISALYGAHEATNFADIVATASSRGDSAIGYRRASSGQVVVNPAKSAPLTLSREDEVLVIAPG